MTAEGWQVLGCCFVWLLGGVWFGRRGRSEAIEYARRDGYLQAATEHRSVIQQLQGTLDMMAAERRVRSTEIGALKTAIADYVNHVIDEESVSFLETAMYKMPDGSENPRKKSAELVRSVWDGTYSEPSPKFGVRP